MLFRTKKATAPADAEKSMFQQPPAEAALPIVGDEAIMKPKHHGTSSVPVQQNLRWQVDRETADRI
eukprot:scaffold15602_cov29-Cylindrotheca_fusiformis.AAC.1